MISMVPVAMSGMSAVCFVAGMVLALLAVPARGMVMMLMTIMIHGTVVACVMVRVGAGGLSRPGLVVSRMAVGVVSVVVACNHAGFLSAVVIMKRSRDRRSGRYQSRGSAW
ncbi:hypothetical protein GCM10009771_15560 [Nesterenkonia flava]